MLRCIRAWGGAPFPNAPRSPNVPLGKYSKSHSGPSATEADAHTFASLRSLQPRVLPFVLSRAALLTRPRPAQPLLLTADSAGSSVFLSPIGVTIAAARPCMFIQCVSKECVSGLCQVRRLHMLILAAIMCASQGEKSSF